MKTDLSWRLGRDVICRNVVDDLPPSSTKGRDVIVCLMTFDRYVVGQSIRYAVIEPTIVFD